MIWLAAAWALAEAVLFVIVADVPLSWIGVRQGWRRGALAAVAAALAAAIGGAAVHFWAGGDPDGAVRTIAALPGVDSAMIAETAAAFASGGYGAMLSGSLSGVPYKLYALAAASQDEPLWRFALLSPFVRLPRFLLAALAAAAIGRLLAPFLSMRGRLVLLAAFWILFYAMYFALMPA